MNDFLNDIGEGIMFGLVVGVASLTVGLGAFLLAHEITDRLTAVPVIYTNSEMIK